MHKYIMNITAIIVMQYAYRIIPHMMLFSMLSMGYRINLIYLYKVLLHQELVFIPI